MSTILNTNGAELEIPRIIDAEGFKCAIFTAKWNPEVTHALRDGAIEVLHKAGVEDKNLFIEDVPGTVEACQCCRYGTDFNARPFGNHYHRMRNPRRYPPFRLCMPDCCPGVSRHAKGRTPVIFGVLTVENLQQALDRAGGNLGNKGSEAAVAAIEMANLHSRAAGLRFAPFRE